MKELAAARHTLHAMKPPRAEGMMVASLPPASMRSASPRRMCSAALQGHGGGRRAWCSGCLVERRTGHPWHSSAHRACMSSTATWMLQRLVAHWPFITCKHPPNMMMATGQVPLGDSGVVAGHSHPVSTGNTRSSLQTAPHDAEGAGGTSGGDGVVGAHEAKVHSQHGAACTAME